jgi:hypothetical protein
MKVKIYRNNKNSMPINEKQKDQFIAALMQGGLSKDKDISNISEEKIIKGIVVEMEHVDKNNPFSEIIARKIVIDHLVEDINYYEKLAKMENE